MSVSGGARLCVFTRGSHVEADDDRDAADAGQIPRLHALLARDERRLAAVVDAAVRRVATRRARADFAHRVAQAREDLLVVPHAGGGEHEQGADLRK